MSRAAVAAAAVLAAGCDDHRPARVADCGGDLRGVWRADDGQRWHAIVGGDAWELYPIEEPAAPAPAGVVAAPSVIDLRRAPPGAATLDGRWTRRYERGPQRCDVSTPATLHDCRGDRVHLDVRAPAPPLDFATCAAPTTDAVTWTLTRI